MTRGNRERSQRYTSRPVDPSRPEPPETFPLPNVPGNGSDTGAYMHPMYVYAPSQQPQAQVGYSGPPPAIPPRPDRLPVQPAYLIGDHANAVPRGLDPIPYQPRTEHVNHHGAPLFPEVPQAHYHARPRGADPGQYGFATPRRPGPEPQYLPMPVQSQSSRGSSSGGSSYGEAPYVYDIPHARPVQVHNQGYNPHARVGLPTTPQAQQLYDVRNQARYSPAAAPPAYAPPPYVGQKKALLVGIDYSKHRDKGLRLKWGVYDAQKMARFLQEDLGFHPNNIRILTDDQHKKNLPTEANIVAGMHWLVEGAQPGDSLFFYFSGHATQVEDQDGDEPEDGLDECLCAMDYNGKKNPPTGIVVDDTMHDIMVKPLPQGCRLTAVLDCCHSGTLLDLPYIYDNHGRLKMNRPDIVERKRSDAVVISLSACKDNGRAWEAGDGGALRKAFIDYMKRWGNGGTPLEVIQSVRAYMAHHGYVQRPQLSSSHWIDTDQRFIVTG